MRGTALRRGVAAASGCARRHDASPAWCAIGAQVMPVYNENEEVEQFMAMLTEVDTVPPV